ncbi:hypothetical protein GUJ93_ZPchr0003g16799 [Zizania palustris]|uniref:HMA domain-containing protein n=1 Tax=Zizania palustris TaxID=103762 RepID=A0A8J5VXA4_ZIZPA|nr:hypothetical protein GUJ93_ZPchr0003g16799 [Zizania palustris]
MGEQVNNGKGEEGGKVEEKKEEAVPAAAEANKEAEEAAATAIKEEQAPPPPPPPVILGVELHCTGCAKRIRRCILRCKGVQGVEVDMAANQLTVTGIVDPQALCARLREKTMRIATVVSPPPPPPPSDDSKSKEDQPAPPSLVHSQVSEPTTVELMVSMHCEACAHQLQKKIVKMRGVQTAETNFSAGKLTVTGTITGDKLADYIHRRTGKLATVVPPPPPPEPPKPEEPKKEEEPPAADKKEDQEGEGTQPAAAEDGSKPKKRGRLQQGRRRHQDQARAGRGEADEQAAGGSRCSGSGRVPAGGDDEADDVLAAV